MLVFFGGKAAQKHQLPMEWVKTGFLENNKKMLQPKLSGSWQIMY
jgi:hypothetical protein